MVRVKRTTQNAKGETDDREASKNHRKQTAAWDHYIELLELRI